MKTKNVDIQGFLYLEETRGVPPPAKNLLSPHMEKFPPVDSPYQIFIPLLHSNFHVITQ